MPPEPTIEDARVAMRVLHAAAPEAAGTVQQRLDYLDAQVVLLSNEDAFRAYLLSRAQQDGAVQTLMQRLDSTILAQLATAEAARANAALIDAENRAQRTMTTGQVLSQPVVLAVVGILSTVLTGLITAMLHLLKAGG